MAVSKLKPAITSKKGLVAGATIRAASDVGDVKNALLNTAQKFMSHAYSPYSHYKVAAALLTDDGKIYAGVNIENASYGATVCAERVAIWNAIAHEGKIKIKAIVVLTKEGWSPCGLCRQVLSEFSRPTTAVHIAKLVNNKPKIINTATMQDLLPLAFSL